MVGKDGLGRRQFITLLGGAAAAPSIFRPRPLAAQQGARRRRVGVLMSLAQGDAVGVARIATLQSALREFGWIEGSNLEFEIRWGASDVALMRKHAAELVGAAPDVIVAHASAATAALQQATGTIPIVFVQGVDPVGAGFVESLARPGGNITGFSSREYQTAGKWLELLREVAPRVTQVGVLRDLTIAAGAGQLGAIHAAAAGSGVQVRPVGISNPAETERAIGILAREPNAGLIVTASALAAMEREKITTLAARHRLPAVYYDRLFIPGGGLMSYGIDIPDLYRRAASYVDRILKGAKPADLPVQQPVRFDLVINLKAAKALGLDVSPMLIARADEVIE